MNESCMLSKMNEFMFQLTEKMSGWLKETLTTLSKNWWDELVVNNLSTLQRENVASKNITTIEGLDLAALLKVLDRNWFLITSNSRYFINNRERSNVKKMMEVRNDWAHITKDDISKEKVIGDVNVIIALMQLMDAKMKETREMEEFIFDVEDDKDIKVKADAKIVAKSNEKQELNETADIAAGTLVTLVSDPSVMGAVLNVIGDKYSVLVGTNVQTFYREQIKPKIDVSTDEYMSLNRVRAALTAYQINNPGSSNLYSLNAARIDFVPYQFRPALKMIKADSPRLLVADDVGVGKTIEAGLMLKEMQARNSIESVLIICPRPLVAEHKWKEEMKRFDEDFTEMDGKTLQMVLSETEKDGEWPDRHKKTIIPYSLFGEDLIMGTESKSDKKKKTIGLNQLDPVPSFDLVIVDEAHTVRNSTSWAYAGVELFCRNAGAVVFLTATPLQNKTEDLYNLLNLLRPDVIYDKDTFKTMSEPNAYVNALLSAVRTQREGWKQDANEYIQGILNTDWGRNVIQHNPNFEKIMDFLDKEEISREEKIEAIGMIETLHSFNSIIIRTRRRDIEDFCIRRNQTVNVEFSPSQRDLYEALIEFEERVLTMLHGSQSVRFMMCTVMRQAASCIYGLAPFMNDIVQRKLREIQEDGELYELDYNLNMDDENYLFELADEIDKLTERLDGNDPKLDKLFEILSQKQEEENNRVIIFSSFRHTLAYVHRFLKNQGFRVAQVDGSVPDEERYKIRERFMMDRDEENAIDVLLFSEVGCEGLDYQFCDTMINYDLPWNPMRIEQRIGRIDRRGQKSDTVKIYNMITENTIDATIYDRCLSKIGVFESSIGDCSEILGDINKEIMKIMFEPGLSDEERKLKIEKLADNDVMKVNEMRNLEKEEKALFGFDLSNLIQNKDVQDAENNWITPESMNDLVNMYMVDRLGEGEYILGQKVSRRLRLAKEKRKLLLDDLKSSEVKNMNKAYKLWKAYLGSDNQMLEVTFDAEYAKDNRKVAFLTQMHPLVVQAAQYESSQFPCEVGVQVDSDELPAGDYEFLIYAWKYKGLRPDIKLVAISDSETVQEIVLNYMQYGSDYEFDDTAHKEKWDAMDSLHHEKWSKDKEAHVNLVREDCTYRKEQLRENTTRREQALRTQMDKVTDEKIQRMRRSQLDRLVSDYEDKKTELEETIGKADIHYDLLVKGVLHVVG